MEKILLYLILLATLNNNLLGQAAGDECSSAVSINVLNSNYVSNTSNYTSGSDPSWVGTSNQFCGSGPNAQTIENNGYYTFVASGNSITFDLCTLAGCASNGSAFGISGIQALIFHLSSGVCGSGTIAKDYCIKQLSGPDCGACGNPKGCVTETVSVTPGETYYFMVDGYEGDDCPYSINFSSGILPVELSDFNTECMGDKSVINWTTQTEINNDFFSVEKSSDGVNFASIAIVNGQGNSSIINHYSVTDDDVGGLSYYRLKQTDYNGAYTYYPMKSTDCWSDEDFSVFPNPAKDNVMIRIGSKITTPFSVLIYNTYGETICTKSFNPNNELYKIDLPENISKGVYLVKVISNSKVFTKKIYVIK